MAIKELSRRISALEATQGDTTRLRNRISRVDILDHVAPVYQELHEDIEAGRHVFYNLPGGRGSGKSSFVSLEVVDQIMKDPTHRTSALVIRKYATTLRGSVFSQVQWAVDTLGVSDLWKASVMPMEYRYTPTGQVIRFSGLDDPVKLKSMKPSAGYFAILWVEEFSEISGEPELRSLQQSVLRGGDRFAVLRSFNPPISRNAWANEYCDREDEKSLTFRTDYTQMPREWLGELFLAEAERLKEINEKAFLHEYMGVPTGTGSEVFPNLQVRTITDEEILNQGYIYQGLDFGFATDPLAFVRLGYDRKTDTILFMDEIVKKGCSNLMTATLIKERGYDRDIVGNRRRIVADAAEPKSIRDLQDCGLKVAKCQKFPGCVQYRIKWLQHRRIVIDPERTPVAAKEFSRYCYEVDRKTGEITSELPDRDNHCIDAAAYALDRLIYRKGISA